MPIRKALSITVFIKIIIILSILQGCSGNKVIPINLKPVPLYSPSDKINMSVLFAYTDKLEDFSYKDGFVLAQSDTDMDLFLDRLFNYMNPDKKMSYRYVNFKNAYLKTIKIDNILRKNAEVTLKNTFDDVNLVHIEGDDYFTGSILDHQLYKKMVSPNTVGIIKPLRPKIISIAECKKPSLTRFSCNRANEVTAEWVFEDLNGNRIWSSEIVGDGSAPIGVFESIETAVGNSLPIAIDDHFRNLATALERAPEIRLFKSCLQIDCNSLLLNPSLLYEKLNKIEDTHERKKIVHQLVFMAIEKDNIDLLHELLFTNYIDINKAEEYSKILPIHLAAKTNNTEAVRLLIKNKSEINTVDNNGWTPMHYAAANGYTSITKLLIQNGANIDAKNSDGQTPFDLAITNGHKNDWQLLIDNGANCNVIVNDNDWIGIAVLNYKIGYYFYEKNDKVKSAEYLKLASNGFKSFLYYNVLATTAKQMSRFHQKQKYRINLYFNYHGARFQKQQQKRAFAEITAFQRGQTLSDIHTLILLHNFTSKAINSFNANITSNYEFPFKPNYSMALDDLSAYYRISELGHKASIEVNDILKCYERNQKQIEVCVVQRP